MPLPVTLSPACPPGWRPFRSGFTWLVADGARCRPGQALARCAFSIAPSPFSPAWPEEQESLQIVVVATCAGVVRQATGSTGGGWRDLHETCAYVAGEAIGEIIPDDAQVSPANLCLMINNRRMTSIVEDREGLSSGWHFRQRVWPLGAKAPRRSVLALGICEMSHALRGADRAYSDVLCGFAQPVQLVTRDDTPLVTTVRVALEHLTRTEEEGQAIWRDLQASLIDTGFALTPDDWMVAGCLGRMLTDRALTERFPLLSAEGLSLSAPADCVALSMMAESPVQLRHKRLGYHLHLHRWLFSRLPQTIRRWFQLNFEQVRITLDDLERDYAALSDRLRSDGRRLCLLNNVASRSSEMIERYVHFTGPLEEQLTTFRNLGVNLMASRLAAGHGVQVVDVDALAAELGVGGKSLDGVHHGPLLESRIRTEFALQAAQGW